jgi:hypothetical protein
VRDIFGKNKKKQKPLVWLRKHKLGVRKGNRKRGRKREEDKMNTIVTRRAMQVWFLELYGGFICSASFVEKLKMDFERENNKRNERGKERGKR